MLKFESIVKIDDPYNSANNKLSVFFFSFQVFQIFYFSFGIEKLKPGACLTQDLYYLPFFPCPITIIEFEYLLYHLLLWKLNSSSSSGHFSIAIIVEI